MALKLSIFTTMTNPDERGDNYEDSLKCFRDLADELIIIDGSGEKSDGYDNVIYGGTKIYYKWPREFDWLQISRSYQKGYDACTGDWALFADLDFIFHENDFDRIRQVMQDNSDKPALSFYKYQFIAPDRYNIKSRRVIAINKALVGDRVKMDGGGDLCQTTLDGQHLTPDDVPESGIPFYNYEKILKTKEQVMDDVGRMERAYKRHFGTTQYNSDGDDKTAFKGWIEAQRGKMNKPQKIIPLSQHPIYIQKTIKSLTPDQFGYDGFGNFKRNIYV